jgi:hypothetical protein
MRGGYGGMRREGGFYKQLQAMVVTNITAV